MAGLEEKYGIRSIQGERISESMKQLEHKEITATPHSLHIVILCDEIILPANIGAVLRLADAFGAERVIFGGEKINLSSPKVKRAARSTHQWIKHYQYKDLQSEIKNLKSEDYMIIALEITDKSQSIHQLQISPGQKYAIIIGSEVNGISDKVLNICDLSVHIPVYGLNSSMNVANALAVILYDITKQYEQAQPDS